MNLTHGEQQNEEIKTISKRSIELELSDSDVKRISQKAGAYGITIAKLLENFIGDLVDGTYSNGSDERMYAQEWFERCNFASCSDNTFLRYLIKDSNSIDDVIELWDYIQSDKEEIDCVKLNSEEKLAIQKNINYLQEQLDDYWKDYVEQKKEYKHETFNEEMKKVLEWKKEYQHFLNE